MSNFSRTPGLFLGFFGGVRVAHLFSFLCCPIMCLYVLCCNVSYNFCIKTMFGSSLPPVFCRRAHVLFTLFVFVCSIMVPNSYCVVILFCFSSSCVIYVASFSGVSIFILPLLYSLTFYLILLSLSVE